ncbi:MAG: AzlD domain-containing protein [Chloroflexota bacterium]|nr:AzlD domain-containing protein [Chloroflexota bacterium]
MSWELLLAIAALTYGSRALALAFLPPLPARLRVLVDRVPPALFAGLAVSGLVNPAAELAPGHVIAAAVGALVVAPLRSLPVCLLAGLAAYALAAFLA